MLPGESGCQKYETGQLVSATVVQSMVLVIIWMASDDKPSHGTQVSLPLQNRAFERTFRALDGANSASMATGDFQDSTTEEIEESDAALKIEKQLSWRVLACLGTHDAFPDLTSLSWSGFFPPLLSLETTTMAGRLAR